MRSELRSCVLTGATLATLASLIAVVVFAINPSVVAMKAGMRLWQVILAYYCGGIVGGAICGSLLRWTNSQLGAAVVGFLSVMPLALAFIMPMIEREHWFPAGIVLAVIFSLMFGSGIAAVMRSESEPR